MLAPELPFRPRMTTAPLAVEFDALDLATLLPVGLHPSALPCRRCGVRQGHHRPTATCPVFARPDLPAGYAYADDLQVGQEFGFLPATGADCRRHVSSASCCVVQDLTVLTSTAAQCGPTTHWVQGSLVVAVEPWALDAVSSGRGGF